MALHRNQSSSSPLGGWPRWLGVLLASCLVTLAAVLGASIGPGAEAQSVSERRQLVQWERRRTNAIEKQARAAEKQARALEEVARRLRSIERACGR